MSPDLQVGGLQATCKTYLNIGSLPASRKEEDYVDSFILEVKQFIIDTLDIEDVNAHEIEDDQAIFGEGLGLDSIDALELGVALSKKYGITIEQESEELHKHFSSPRAIALFIKSMQENVPAA